MPGKTKKSTDSSLLSSIFSDSLSTCLKERSCSDCDTHSVTSTDTTSLFTETRTRDTCTRETRGKQSSTCDTITVPKKTKSTKHSCETHHDDECLKEKVCFEIRHGR